MDPGEDDRYQSRDFLTYKVFFVQQLTDVILSSYARIDSNDIETEIRILPGSVLQGMLNNSDVIDNFIQAFTHKSYDYERNYESVETYGDTFINNLTGLEIRSKFPTLDPEAISNMLAHYKSNAYLAQCISAGIPELDNLILRKKTQDITDKIRADIFEAFTLVLFEQTERYFHGIGFAACNNFYHKLTANFPMVPEHTKGNPKSRVIELFGKAPGNVVEEPPKKAIYVPAQGLKVVVSPEAYRAILREVKYSDEFINQKLAIGDNVVKVEAKDRNTASTKAYQIILNRLEAIPVTAELLEDARNAEALDKYSDKTRLINISASKDEELSFRKRPAADEELISWELIAHNKLTGRKRIAASIDVPKDSSQFRFAKRALYDIYIEENTK